MYGSFTAGEAGVVFVPRNLPKKDVLSAVEAVNFRDLLDKIYKNDEDKNHVDNEKGRDKTEEDDGDQNYRQGEEDSQPRDDDKNKSNDEDNKS